MRAKTERTASIVNSVNERYTKSLTKLHARLPSSMEDQINVGDMIRIQECRPLSKIIHFIVVEKIKSKEERK